jgi:hypothetical protein
MGNLAYNSKQNMNLVNLLIKLIYCRMNQICERFFKKEL